MMLVSPTPGGESWHCLGGPIGRFMDQLGPINPSGWHLTKVDLTTLPFGGGLAVRPGDTWYFQLWFRKGASSGFSQSRAVTFR